jgi:hypothetical protein
MKLQDLAVLPQTKQIAKVFESYFGNTITFESISKRHAHAMLGRVRGLISEHRATTSYHGSEKSPAYLKLVMMEQVLTKKLREEFPGTTTGGVTTGAAGTPGAANPDAAKQAAAVIATTKDPKMKQALERAAKGQNLTLDDQKLVASAALAKMENRRRTGRRLSESEVQQAQVILASQDMVDQVQKMIEQVTSLQFKDLPALVDQIRNEIGYEQATKFNADATAALGGMVQNLQGSKTQLEAAMGTVTGQAPVIPGAAAAELPVDPMADPMAAAPTDELDIDADIDIDAEEPAPAGLGRDRR